MPQLDPTVFFFLMLFIFVFIFFVCPWTGFGVLAPITTSLFIRRFFELRAWVFAMLSLINCVSRVLGGSLRSFFLFSSGICELPSIFSKFLSRNIAYFFRPAGFLLAFAGVDIVDDTTIDIDIDIDFNFEGTFEDYYFENKFPDLVAEICAEEKCEGSFFLRSLLSEILSDIEQRDYLDSLWMSQDILVDCEVWAEFWISAYESFLSDWTVEEAFDVDPFSDYWPHIHLTTAEILDLARRGQLSPSYVFNPSSDYQSYDFIVFLEDLLGYVFLLVGVLLSVAFLTLAERKIMASSQRRMGPNMVGFWGVLQPVADGLKLILKDADVPARATKILFFVAALLPFVTAFTSWIIVPLSPAPLSDFSAGPLWVAAISSLGVYGIIFSGWASNSKYAFLGGLRSAAQVISYELVLSLVYLTVTVWNQTLNFYTIVEYQDRVCWNVFALFPCAVAFLIAMLAETNRTPFDLPEAESELVAGYNVEYRGVLFSLFFLAEYANMILMAALFSILFLGGWMPLSFSLGSTSITLLPGSIFFILKIEAILAFFILARAALPRVRYDQLMILGWKYLIPFLFGFFFLVSSLVFFVVLP